MNEKRVVREVIFLEEIAIPISYSFSKNNSSIFLVRTSLQIIVITTNGKQ